MGHQKLHSTIPSLYLCFLFGSGFLPQHIGMQQRSRHRTCQLQQYLELPYGLMDAASPTYLILEWPLPSSCLKYEQMDELIDPMISPIHVFSRSIVQLTVY